jgi:PIN domain nuclease of toxin-antitoxin system
MVVLDTSTLLFWTAVPERLSARAEKTILDERELVISSISLWEIGLKVKRQQLFIPISLREYIDWLKGVDGVQIVPVTEETWLSNLELDWNHKDPADRTIVATALLLDCPLITSDRQIQSFYPSAIW